MVVCVRCCQMSIGDTGLWPEMRVHHPIAGVVYCYVFFLFMGFTMVNIFLAIIMDSYADVVGEARAVSLAAPSSACNPRS